MFCKASTELAKENTVLVSEIFIVYIFFFFFFCQMTVTQKKMDTSGVVKTMIPEVNLSKILLQRMTFVL